MDPIRDPGNDIAPFGYIALAGGVGCGVPCRIRRRPDEYRWSPPSPAMDCRGTVFRSATDVSIRNRMAPSGPYILVCGLTGGVERGRMSSPIVSSSLLKDCCPEA